MVREEMQSQGMKLAGALLAGIGTRYWYCKCTEDSREIYAGRSGITRSVRFIRISIKVCPHNSFTLKS